MNNVTPLDKKRDAIVSETTSEYSNFKNNKESYKKKIDAFLVEFKKELENMSIEYITNRQTNNKTSS
jgi:hypothetical protein